MTDTRKQAAKMYRHLRLSLLTSLCTLAASGSGRAQNVNVDTLAPSPMRSAPRTSQWPNSIRYSTFSIGLCRAEPLDQFSVVQENGYFGIGAQAAFHLKDRPVDLGFGLGWDWLEKKTMAVTVDRISLPDTTGELVVKNQSYAILPMIRYRPFQGPFMCYAEAFGGARLFMTNSMINVDSRERPVMRDYQKADIALEWGLAAGIFIRTNNNVFIEARFARTWGDQAGFVDLDSIRQDGQGEVAFDTKTSRTENWRIQVGVGQYFR